MFVTFESVRTPSVASAFHPEGSPVTVTVSDVDNNVLGTCQITEALNATKMAPFNVPWTAPLVFDRASVTISATASAAVRFGVFHLPYTETGYTVKAPGH